MRGLQILPAPIPGVRNDGDKKIPRLIVRDDGTLAKFPLANVGNAEGLPFSALNIFALQQTLPTSFSLRGVRRNDIVKPFHLGDIEFMPPSKRVQSWRVKLLLYRQVMNSMVGI